MDGIEVLLEGGLELGFAVFDGKGTKKKFGCLVFIVIACLIGWIIWYNPEAPIKINGLITKKLSEDRVLLRTRTKEDVYTITHELYSNKKVGDSLTIIK